MADVPWNSSVLNAGTLTIVHPACMGIGALLLPPRSAN